MEVLEPGHAGAFILTEANGKRSRANVTVQTGQVLVAGSVLGATAVGAAVAAADAGNVGNGAMGAVTVGDGAIPGAYRLIIIAEATNAGAFTVENPEGVTVGEGNVAAAFEGGGIAFTLADGATDFAVGDSFTITVAEGSGTVREFDPDSAVGAGVAMGVLIYDADATDGPVDVAAIVRDAEVNVNELVFNDTLTEDEIAEAISQLAARGIFAR